MSKNSAKSNYQSCIDWLAVRGQLSKVKDDSTPKYGGKFSKADVYNQK